MRKQSVFVRCDGNGCKEIGEVVDLRETPEGWYTVRQADENLKLREQGFDFHSLRCLERWAKARRSIFEPKSNGFNEDKSEDLKEAVRLALVDATWFKSQDIQGLTGLAQSTVDRHLGKLTEEGFIRRLGSEHPRMYCQGENWTNE